MKSQAITLSVVTILAALSGVARAELQNVVVNGGYGVKDENRFVRVQGLSGERWRSSPLFLVQGSGGAARYDDVEIPTPPTPREYSELGRVCLSFYVGVPAWREDNAGSIELRLLVDGYEAFKRTFSERGWHLCFVEMAPWSGKHVDLYFRAGWIDGGWSDVVIALPRVVAWHGPKYAGIGGISHGPGLHGYPILSRIAPEDVGDPEAAIATAGVDCSIWDRGGLLLQRVDALEPSRVATQSELQTNVTALPAGYHWLPVQLPAEPEPKYLVRTVDGLVEQGPIDVIPNFLAYDAARLYFIGSGLIERKRVGR